MVEKKEDTINEEIENEELEPEEDQVREEDSLEEGLKDKEKEITELKDSFLRLQADFINYKNRVAKEKENIYAYATEDLMVEILPILDNFQRAMENKDGEDGFYKGIEMIFKQLMEVLEANGLKEIQCLGEAFDPNFHHAVFMEKLEEAEEGTVLEVLQKGYMLKDKVIRPSMVKVAE